jgi:hypothetical protein
MTPNIISGNWAGGEGLGYGGGIAAESYYGTITIGYNIITGNNAHYQGGGISCHSFSNGTVMIANNVITENESRDLHSGDGGGGIYCVDGPVTISNNTISGNDVTGGGHGHGGGIYCYDANVTVINSILWNNTADEIYFYSGSVTVSYSDVQGGYPGTGNIDKDPLFVTGPSGGYYLSQFTAGQSANSPCVDSGNPLSDMIFGTTRTDMKPDILINDMGYHYPITSSSLDMSIKLPPGSLLEGPPGYDKRIGPN